MIHASCPCCGVELPPHHAECTFSHDCPEECNDFEQLAELKAEIARLKATAEKLWEIAASSIDPPERRRMLDRLGMDSFSEDG